MFRRVIAGLLIALCAIEAHAVTYRYVRITSITGFASGTADYTSAYTSLGTLRLSDGGSPISPSGHSVTASDANGDYPASNVLDSDAGTIWHTEFDPSDVPQPHWIIYDAGSPITLDRVLWTNATGFANGHLGDYEIEGSNDGVAWTPIGEGTAQTGGPTLGATLTLLVSDPPSSGPINMLQNIGAGFGPHKSQQLGGLLQ
jgi:hypothetical protein